MTHTPEPAFRSLDHISSNAQDTSKLAALSARIADLEAQLYAIGAGGVGQSIKPQVQADTAQKPVAWRVHPFDYGVGSDGVYALTMRTEQVEVWQRKEWKVEPLYAAPQPARQPLTDEKLYALYCEAMKGYYVSALHHWRNAEAHKFARAIEAAVANQPARQPLTEEQVLNLGPGQDCAVWSYESQIYFARAIEAAHGITGGQQ